jgi:DnaJ-domain-containing protein 1
MSIGRRLIDLARAELNSLLDRAADYEDESADDHRWGGSSDPSSMSDRELEEEIERRRRARQEAEDAAQGKHRYPDPPSSSSSSSSSRPPRRTAAGDEALRKAYAALEVPQGSDFETVRKSYRRLMRKYHPDLHGGAPDKQRAATDLTQRLTEAYKTLEKQLRR